MAIQPNNQPSNYVATLPPDSLAMLPPITNDRNEDVNFSRFLRSIIPSSLDPMLRQMAYGTPTYRGGGKSNSADIERFDGFDFSLQSCQDSIADGRSSSAFTLPPTMDAVRAYRHLTTNDFLLSVQDLQGRPNALYNVDDRSRDISVRAFAGFSSFLEVLFSRYLISYIMHGHVIKLPVSGVTRNTLTGANQVGSTAITATIEKATNNVLAPKSKTIAFGAKQGRQALNEIMDVADGIRSNLNTDEQDQRVIILVPQFESLLLQNVLRDEMTAFNTSVNFTQTVQAYLGRNVLATGSWARKFVPANVLLNAFGGDSVSLSTQLFTCPDTFIDSLISIPTTASGMETQKLTSGSNASFTKASNVMRYVAFSPTIVKWGYFERAEAEQLRSNKMPSDQISHFYKEAQNMVALTNSKGIVCGKLSLPTS